MPDLSRRGFIGIISIAPLAGLILGQTESCIIRAYNGGTLVAGPFVTKFRMNSVMKVHISEGHRFRVDRLVMEAPTIDRVFEREFEAVDVTPSITLDIRWTCKEE